MLYEVITDPTIAEPIRPGKTGQEAEKYIFTPVYKPEERPYKSVMTDLRIIDRIVPGVSGDVVLIGFPEDEGVRRNGGRPGARQGPARFRHWLSRYGTAENP